MCIRDRDSPEAQAHRTNLEQQLGENWESSLKNNYIGSIGLGIHQMERVMDLETKNVRPETFAEAVKRAEANLEAGKTLRADPEVRASQGQGDGYLSRMLDW